MTEAAGDMRNVGTSNANNSPQPIQDFYRNKTVLLTGCTGAVGEVCMEKLLRCDTKVVYLFCRPKLGCEPMDRLEKQFNTDLFAELRRTRPQFRQRIRIVAADLRSAGMAMAPDMRAELVRNVDIVMHLAADVKFDQQLDDILATNVGGTREMLRLAAEMHRLTAFAYVSTAFSNCVHSEVAERFYQPPIDGDAAIRLAEYFAAGDHRNRTILNAMTARLIAPWPNVYTYSKAVAEDLVRRASITGKFAMTVIRPSIVLSTYQDPVPGYGTNVYGMMGFFVATGAGVMRLQPGNASYQSNIIFSDYVSNGTMVAIWDVCQRNVRGTENKAIDMSEKSIGTSEAKVFNISLTFNNYEHHHLSNSMYDEYKKAPYDKTVWYPCIKLRSASIAIFLGNMFSQFLPAFLIDLILLATNSEQRVLPLYRKIVFFSEKMLYFCAHEWNMHNDNLTNAWERMTDADQTFFPCNLNGIDWDDYVPIAMGGIKKYIVHDRSDANGMAAARTKLFRLKCLHYGLISVLNVSLAWLAWSYDMYVPLGMILAFWVL